ncbi:MAG: hypothetical protein K0S81_2204 [Rhodospirillales bacterium]|nr:hypothetical protein [Rhodospirillales bacterium]
MNRIWIAAALALLGSDAAPIRAVAADAAAPVVVELFTSQGCSSCPPADAFLGELAQRQDVIALAFHIDYWDYIGWKDPFASPDFTKRQRGYAGALGLRSVYTPQMVIDGRVDAVGSHRNRVEELIRKSSYVPKLAVTLEPAAGKARLNLPEARFERPATIWLAIYDREERTKVKRGENAGRELSEYNIVRALRKIGSWDGSAQSLDLDLADAIADGMGGAILIQSEGQGPIIGALEIPAAALRGSAE